MSRRWWRALTPEQFDQMRRLYESGQSCNRVAAAMGLSPHSVNKYLHRLGVPVRDRRDPVYWRESRGTLNHGYIAVSVAGRRVYQHRLVMEQILGRPLRRTEHVHHINGNKADNRPENLEVLPEGEHHRLHGMGAYHRPDLTIAEVAELHRNGLTVHAITERLGCHHTTVVRRLRAHQREVGS